MCVSPQIWRLMISWWFHAFLCKAGSTSIAPTLGYRAIPIYFLINTIIIPHQLSVISHQPLTITYHPSSIIRFFISIIHVTIKNQAPSAIHLDFSSQELYWQTDATSTINIIEPLSILIHQPPSCSIHQLQTPVINQERSSTINYYQPSFINYQPQAEHRNSIHVLLIRPSKGCEGNQGEVAAHWTATGWNRIINSWSTILGASWIVDPRIDQALCTEPWNCMVGWENGWTF